MPGTVTAGNNAICILADSIKTAISDDDLVIRYGGDEFLILSLTTDKDYWPAIGKKVNNIMQKQVMRQKLPYNIGVSLGFVISDNADDPIPITQGINLADAAMYSDKQSRKKTGNRG